MTSLLPRVLLPIAAAAVPAVLLGTAAVAGAAGDGWLVALGAAAAVAGGVLLAEALTRQPVLRLVAVGGRRRGVGTRRPAREMPADAPVAAERTRRALAECEARLRLALAAQEVSVYEIDLAGNRVWFDDRAAALTCGLIPSNTWISRNDPGWRNWLDRIHPDDREVRRTQLRAVMEGKIDTFTLTYRYRDPGNAWRWLAHRGAIVARAPGSRAPLRIVVAAREVTEQHDRAAALERQVAERTAALQERERRFRGIFDSSFQLTGLLTCDGVVLELNRAAREFHGVTEAEVIGRRVWEFGPWSICPRAVADFQARLAQAAAGNFVRYEVSHPDATGRPVSFDFSLKPVFDESGAVTMLVTEARDITERTGLQAQLVQAQKMETVGQLTGGVAHDFNNLLQALMGNLDLIRRLGEASGDARLLQLTANAQRAAGRGAQLTKQLLAFSRRQKLRTEYVRVNRLTADMNDLLRRAAGETVHMEIRAEPELWACEVDPTQFETTLLNLVINARDAMPDGGTVTVAACNIMLSADAALRLDVAAGAYVRVDVADTGTGIAAEHLPRLFEPFFTTKEAGKGTGLGLAMVHGFARQAGGTVTIASTPERGTTVSLFLPRATEDAPAAGAPTAADVPAARVEAPPRQPRTDGLGILLVEDEAEVREAMQFALADEGHRVHVAGDANEALAILDGGEQLDLLLCDVMLPGGMDGLELARAARRQRPHLRVLLASGYGAEMLEGCGDYELLTKPFTQAALLRRVAETRMAAAAD